MTVALASAGSGPDRVFLGTAPAGHAWTVILITVTGAVAQSLEGEITLRSFAVLVV